MQFFEGLKNLKIAFFGAASEDETAPAPLPPSRGGESIEKELQNSGTGKITRLPDGGSAEDLPSGAKIYRNKDGQLDRDGGPAVLLPNGAKAWYTNGLCTGKEWYSEGKSYREEMPAAHPDGSLEWFSRGRKTTAPPALEAALPKMG